MKRIATTLALLALAVVGPLAFPSLGQGHIVLQGSTVAPLPEATDVVAVARGKATIGLLSDGSIVTDPWAAGYTVLVADAPDGAGYVQISCQDHHALALHADGSIFAWGTDQYGVVTQTPNGTGFIQVAAGFNHNAALDQDGSLVSWGRNQFGQVSHTPSGSGYVQVAVGVSHSVALHSDGSLTAWGHNLQGATSDVPSGNDFIQISCSAGSNWALRSNGTIVCWGVGANGGAVELPDPGPFTRLLGSRFAERADGTLLAWDTFIETGELPALSGNQFLTVAGVPGAAVYLVGGDHGTAFCSALSSTVGCPCDPASVPGTGCPNSDWSGAKLVGFGRMSLSEDSFGLFVSDLPPQGAGVILRGANQAAGGQGIPLSNGLLCVVGQSKRSHVVSPEAMGHVLVTHYDGAPFGLSAVGVGVPTNYQYWYRDAFNTCSTFPTGFNFSNALEVVWTP